MFTDFYNAWDYLEKHPIFNTIKYGINVNKFISCIDIEVKKVNSKTNMSEDNERLNIKTRVWIEAGPYIKNHAAHDYDLDCGGDTFEEAIIELANLVKNKYGDDPIKIKKIVNKQYGNI